MKIVELNKTAEKSNAASQVNSDSSGKSFLEMKRTVCSGDAHVQLPLILILW